MNLTDAQVRALYVSDPRNESVQRELRARTRRALLRRLPSPEGTCRAGYRVRLDDKGAYSSGYPYHLTATGMAASVCAHWQDGGITWDDDSPERERILRLMDVLSLRDHDAAMRLLNDQLSGRG